LNIGHPAEAATQLVVGAAPTADDCARAIELPKNTYEKTNAMLK
jgi:hypothetical protein